MARLKAQGIWSEPLILPCKSFLRIQGDKVTNSGFDQ